MSTSRRSASLADAELASVATNHQIARGYAGVRGDGCRRLLDELHLIAEVRALRGHLVRDLEVQEIGCAADQLRELFRPLLADQRVRVLPFR